MAADAGVLAGVPMRLAGQARRLVHTMWMPRSCRCMCMIASFTPYVLVRAAPKWLVPVFHARAIVALALSPEKSHAPRDLRSRLVNSRLGIIEK